MSNLETAISDYIKSYAEDGTFVTGWVSVVALSSPTSDQNGSSNYAIVTSEGLPYHTEVGLLKVALDDKQSLSMVNTFNAHMLEFFGEDDEDDE